MINKMNNHPFTPSNSNCFLSSKNAVPASTDKLYPARVTVTEWLTFPSAVPASSAAGREFEPRHGHGGLVAGRLGASPHIVRLT